MIERHKSVGFLIICCAFLVGFLAYFKYLNFFINTIKKMFERETISLNIIIPIGISFYIFSAISYLIDVYRGEENAEKNILHFSLFLSFFPKIVAGPIIRAKDFLPQIKNYRGIEIKRFECGIQMFALGLFKKIVLADHLSVFVDDVFFAPCAYNTGTVILAVISYSLQIYFDFSGYSDMAIGIAKILGFDFKQNFNLPYISANLSEFWKRWHISLSSWLQDYIYIPLGGNRKGKYRTYINIIIVMIISGLWHGAGWTFIVWGGIHGIMSCFNKAYGNNLLKLGKIPNIIMTYILVSLTWIVFRSNTLTNAYIFIRQLLTMHTGMSQPYTWSFIAMFYSAIEVIYCVVVSKRARINKDDVLQVNYSYPIMDLSKTWCLIVFFTFCGIIIILGYYGNTAFIYGAF